MKKITLLIAILVATVSFAQNVVIDRPSNGVNSIISVNGTDGNQVFCADRFSLTAATALGEIDILGFNSNGGSLGALLHGFSIYIYSDNANLPSSDPTQIGTGVVELPSAFAITINDAGGAGEFTVPFTLANGGSQIVLPAGDYWMVVGAIVDDSLGNGRWNWNLSDFVAAVEPVLIDPADLFGAGATSWSNISGLIGASATSMAWQLRDEPILGVNDNLAAYTSIYPNPMTDVLNIKVPANVEITKATLYDVLGKDTGIKASNGTMNTAGLTAGIYMLKVETSAGTLTQKVIKQ